MEQYWMKKENDFDTLRYCLDNYKANHAFVRLIGSMGGDTKVAEDLEGRVFDFEKDKNGAKFFIDSKEVMTFPLNDYTKGFSLQYERFHEDGRMFFYSGVPNNPDEEGLPEIKQSVIRAALDWHLVEISFEGKIDLVEDGWFNEPYMKYWKPLKKNS